MGGGNSGIEEGLFLTKFASKVTVLELGDKLGATGEGTTAALMIRQHLEKTQGSRGY